MARPPRTYAIGPATGPLRLRTTREGVASRAGHDLLVGLADWSGTVVVGASVEVEVELESFEVLEGSGGVAPLTGRDKAAIAATARRLLGTEEHPRAVYGSTGVDVPGGVVSGTLTLRGLTVPVDLDVTPTGPKAWRASTTVLQSDFGITPYRALFGALRLADAVRVEVEVDLG